MTIIKNSNRYDTPKVSPTHSDLSVIPIPPVNPAVYLLRTSGQVGTPSPTSNDTKLPKGFADQARNALANVGASLAVHGASPRDISKLTIYIVGLEEAKKEPLIQAIREYFLGPDGKHHKPAISLVGVAALSEPDYLIQIDAEAAVAV